jgi:hypothetical protein
MVGAIDHALSYSLASLRARVSSTPLPSLPPPSFLDTVVRPRQDLHWFHSSLSSFRLSLSKAVNVYTRLGRLFSLLHHLFAIRLFSQGTRAGNHYCHVICALRPSNRTARRGEPVRSPQGVLEEREPLSTTTRPQHPSRATHRAPPSRKSAVPRRLV